MVKQVIRHGVLPQGLSLILTVTLLFAGGVDAETKAVVPADPVKQTPLHTENQEHENVSDFWRAVRDGRAGYVVNPDSQSNILIRNWPKDCAREGNCSERAVGFTLRVHELMPAIFEPEGKKATTAGLLFLLLVFIFLVVAGLMFIQKLGHEQPDDGAVDG